MHIECFKLTDPQGTLGVNYDVGNYKVSCLEPFKDYVLKVLQEGDQSEEKREQSPQKPTVVVNFVNYVDFLQIMSLISPLNVDIIIKTNEYFDAMAPESVLQQQFLRTVALFHKGLFLCTSSEEDFQGIYLVDPVHVYNIEKEPKLWFPKGYDTEHKIKLLAAAGIYDDSKVPLLRDLDELSSLRKLYEDYLQDLNQIEVLLSRLDQNIPTEKVEVERVQLFQNFLHHLKEKSQ